MLKILIDTTLKSRFIKKLIKGTMPTKKEPPVKKYIQLNFKQSNKFTGKCPFCQHY